jgi:hypothetical protein
MEESATYQAIVRRGREEGREEEARRFLFMLGEAKFGLADAAVHAAIERISDVKRLEELGVRIGQVGSWKELLSPGTHRRHRAPPRTRR